MNTENIMEYSKKEMIAESMIGSDLDFKKFSQLDLAAGLLRQDAMDLFSCMTKEEFAVNETIYSAGEHAMGMMYLILDGKVSVKSESGHKYTSLRKGDVFGLFSFLDDQRKHSATLTVEEDVVALTMNRAYFDLISIEEPKLGNQLMHFMFTLLSKKASELEIEYSHMHKFAFGGKV